VVADEQGLCGLDGDDAFLALWYHRISCFSSLLDRERATFFAFRESSDASMVMYFTPLILMPLEMTCFGSLLSEKEAAMALRSSSET
jgi:hypothetical protein